jgi:hypothetical protein
VAAAAAQELAGVIRWLLVALGVVVALAILQQEITVLLTLGAAAADLAEMLLLAGTADQES